MMATESSVSLQSISRKRALLIGNNKYKKGRTLKFCVDHARDLYDKLCPIQFQVTLGTDLTCEDMDTMIEEFTEDICPGDLILFFYSGYALYSNNQNFLLPVDDNQINAFSDSQFEMVNVQDMCRSMLARSPSAVIFLFDACRHYSIVDDATLRERINFSGLTHMEALPGCFIAFAGDAKKSLPDTSLNDRHTLFISHLFEHIDQPNLSVTEMMNIVSDDIMSDTNGEQCPFRANSLRKNIYLNYQIQHGTPSDCFCYYFTHLLLLGLKQELNPRLAKIIDESPSHSLIDLGHQDLVDRDMDSIVQHVLIKKECTRLSLGGNKITSIGAASLATALSTNTILQRLYLSDNRLCDKGVKLLAKALATSNQSLQILNLQENAISDAGAEHVAEMLKTNTTLVGLWLDKNDIGNVGVRLLTDALINHNKKLEYLGLSKNQRITDASLDTLEQMIKNNRSMNELSIHECGFSRAGKERLRKSIQTKANFSIRTNSWDQ